MQDIRDRLGSKEQSDMKGCGPVIKGSGPVIKGSGPVIK
jgi:hypothetical protein